MNQSRHQRREAKVNRRRNRIKRNKRPRRVKEEDETRIAGEGVAKLESGMTTWIKEYAKRRADRRTLRNKRQRVKECPNVDCLADVPTSFTSYCPECGTKA